MRKILLSDIAAVTRHHAKLISWRVAGSIRDTVAVNTRMGRFTVLTCYEAIGAQLYREGQFELEFIQRSLGLLRGLQLIPPPGQGVVPDVGANNGVISIGMLKLCPRPWKSSATMETTTTRHLCRSEMTFRQLEVTRGRQSFASAV